MRTKPTNPSPGSPADHLLTAMAQLQDRREQLLAALDRADRLICAMGPAIQAITSREEAA